MRHYRNSRDGVYRVRNGMILGVCGGLAKFFDISVFWVRVICLMLLVFTGFWPVIGVYLLAALLMKPEPVAPIASDAEREFYNSYASSRSGALGRIKRKFEYLDRRIQRIEDVVTSKDYDWERRMGR